MTQSPADQNAHHAVAVDSAVARFAAELRELRAGAGSPSFRAMGRMTNYAPSTLSDVTQGRRMPTRAVSEAFARACAADPDEWGERWEQAAAESGGAVSSVPAPDPVPTHRRPLLLATALAISAAAAGSALTWLATSRTAIPSTNTSATVTASTFAFPSDGQDPAPAGCSADATVLGDTPVSVKSVGTGMLELKYSARCQAG